MTRNEHETEDQCADLLKDILVETREEKKNSLGVPHQRSGTLHGTEEAAIRLIVSHSLTFQTERQSENWGVGGGGNRGQHLT